jgi:uncharacterized protein (DUF1778 family)
MTPIETASTKSANINLRVAPAQRDLIDRAAHVVGKTRTEFILDAVTREAENTLLAQRLFLLDETQWDAFTAALDAPPLPNDKLHRLLTNDAPWG